MSSPLQCCTTNAEQTEQVTQRTDIQIVSNIFHRCAERSDTVASGPVPHSPRKISSPAHPHLYPKPPAAGGPLFPQSPLARDEQFR